jgi:MFS family permease
MFREVSVRNAMVLSACQAISQSGSVMVFVVVALAGKSLAPVPELATLPLGIQYVAMMAATVPASLLMGRFGRRAGFCIGQGIGLVGALVATWGVASGSFWIFTAASVGIGAHNAFFQYLRFAAADTASPAFRPKAISWVMLGGVVAGLVGPELAKRTADLLEPAVFAGSYLALAGLCVLNILALQGVRIPRPSKVEHGTSGRPFSAVVRQPVFIAAVLAAVVGYGMMNLLMVATPLAMAGCGFSFGHSAEVIRWHVLGMYVPSFFTGTLIRRFGVLRVIAAGAVLLILCIAINLAGVAFVNFMAALVLLGVGWNFMFVGATTLLAGTHRPEERAKAQGFNDFMVFSTTAITSFASGAMQTALGWQAVNVLSLFPVVLALGVVVWLARHEDDTRAAMNS